jgi:ADP-dependent phosphofructokinase/glucokinase
MLLYVKTSLLMFPREILSFSSFSGRILWTVLREKTTSLHIVENKIDIL